MKENGLMENNMETEFIQLMENQKKVFGLKEKGRSGLIKRKSNKINHENVFSIVNYKILEIFLNYLSFFY